MNLGWKAHAACRTLPGPQWDGDLTPDMFETCMGCPVRGNCLLEALDHEDRADGGVWGGTSADQRRLIRKGADPARMWDESRRAFAQQRLAA